LFVKIRASAGPGPQWNFRRGTAFSRQPNEKRKDRTMGRGLLLWLIGIPLPIILLIWAFGGLS
jgi:hypothetical protein